MPLKIVKTLARRICAALREVRSRYSLVRPAATRAAARAALAYAGFVNGTVMVQIPGGQVEVTIDGDTSTLRGPSALVATGGLHCAALN